MGEEDIKKEHQGAIIFIGQKVYQLFLPLLEIHEALGRVLQLNREMYALKEKEKKEAAKPVAVPDAPPAA